MDNELDLTSIDLPQILAILERFAKGCPSESMESKAMEIAAHAIFYVYRESVYEKFRKVVANCHGVLSPEQEAYLRHIGVLIDGSKT